MNGEREHRESTGFSRRSFLGKVGVGAVALGAPGALAAPGRAAPHHSGAAHRHAGITQHFGRIFDRMRPFADPGKKGLEAALVDIGSPGGILDARDALDRGPVDLITDLSLSAHNPEQPHAHGRDDLLRPVHGPRHDLRHRRRRWASRPTRSARRTAGRRRSTSTRCTGPARSGSPQLYDPTDRAKLKVESGGLFEDVPRMADGTAIIGDPRNDENVVISGLQAAFLKFHNNAVDRLRAGGTTERQPRLYSEARRLTTWHYQWMILHEFLPLFVGQSMVDSIVRRGRRFYRPGKGEAFIPVEFQGAAYRFGHSMVRPSYRANLAGDGGKAFFGMIFDPKRDRPRPRRPAGGFRAPRRFIDWQTFFDFGDGQVKPNKRIDTTISTPLFDLPLGAIANHAPPTVLAVRTLLRHITWELPSGQSIARRFGVSALAPADLDELHRLRARARALDAALVLRAQGGRARRGRPAPRPGRRPARRRGGGRTARERPGGVPVLRP